MWKQVTTLTGYWLNSRGVDLYKLKIWKPEAKNYLTKYLINKTNLNTNIVMCYVVSNFIVVKFVL